MKVIGINASQRKKANTQTLVEAILSGAEDKWMPRMWRLQKASGKMCEKRRFDAITPGNDNLRCNYHGNTCLLVPCDISIQNVGWSPLLFSGVWRKPRNRRNNNQIRVSWRKKRPKKLALVLYHRFNSTKSLLGMRWMNFAFLHRNFSICGKWRHLL